VIEDLVPNYPHHLEGLCGGDGVDEHVTVDADIVLGVEYTVLILLGPRVSERVGSLGLDGLLT
jgi:hypothetical protein